MGEICDIAGGNGVGDRLKYNRQAAGGIAQRPRGIAANAHDDIGREGDELFGLLVNLPWLAIAPTDKELFIAALVPAQLPHGLPKSLLAHLVGATFGRASEHANLLLARLLLCARRKRPCHGSAADKRDEFAASHRVPQASDLLSGSAAPA